MTETYLFNLLQTKAYRLFNVSLNEVLHKYHISPLDWSFLGLLYENEEGILFHELADELGVEPPLVTTLAIGLERKKLIKRVAEKDDKRAKRLLLTGKGSQFVEKTELSLKEELKKVFHGVSIELLVYTKVLETIIKNTQNSRKDQKKKSIKA